MIMTVKGKMRMFINTFLVQRNSKNTQNMHTLIILHTCHKSIIQGIRTLIILHKCMKSSYTVQYKHDREIFTHKEGASPHNDSLAERWGEERLTVSTASLAGGGRPRPTSAGHTPTSGSHSRRLQPNRESRANLHSHTVLHQRCVYL